MPSTSLRGVLRLPRWRLPWWRVPGWIRRIARHYRGKLGQWLLHSRLHPLYLKLAKPQSLTLAYRAWVAREQAAIPPAEWFRDRESRFSRRPVCSILIPVYNPDREWLRQALESVRLQYYSRWQLCICDDASREPWVAQYLAEAAAADSRIRFVGSPRRLGISGALNCAAVLAEGQYLTFLDQDDILAPYALHYVVEALQGEALQPEAPEEEGPDLVYSDEDKLDESGLRVEPIFKPAWSPDLLLSCMYLGHLLVVKRRRFLEADGFRTEMDGSQDHDLALRVCCRKPIVRHIPRVLYHWRKHAASTAAAPFAKPYAQAAGRRAVSDAMVRRGVAAEVVDGPAPHTYRVQRSATGAGMASIVICTSNRRQVRRCMQAVTACTDYRDREFIVVQYGAAQHGTDLRVSNVAGAALQYDGELNWPRMCNLGARAAHGKWLLFLHDDVAPLRREWLTELAAHIQRPEAGVVGARLVYRSGAMQHTGLVSGMMRGVGHPGRGVFGSPLWHWFGLTRNVTAVTGACLAIRRAVFDEVGGLDESFPAGFGDADLCMKVRQAGYEIIYEPAAILRHDESCALGSRGHGQECEGEQCGRDQREQWEKREREEGERWRRKWPFAGAGQDPFYSPHLRADREEPTLWLEEPMTPGDNSR